MKFKLPCGKEIACWLNKDKYLVHKVNGKNKPIHRTIYELYNGQIPNGLTINHKDGNKYNNDISNLELMTFSENAKHSWENGLAKPCKGETHGRSVLDDIMVLTILTMPKNPKNGVGNGWKNETLSKIFKVSITRISAIRNRKEWKHIHDSIWN